MTLLETIRKDREEFDEKFEDLLVFIANEYLFRNEDRRLKSHLHQSQINLLKALVEELDGFKCRCRCEANIRLAQVQELINKTIEETK